MYISLAHNPRFLAVVVVCPVERRSDVRSRKSGERGGRRTGMLCYSISWRARVDGMICCALKKEGRFIRWW